MAVVSTFPHPRRVLRVAALAAAIAWASGGCARHAPLRVDSPSSAEDTPIGRLPPEPGGKLVDGLAARVADAEAGAWFDVLVDLTEQVDLTALGIRLDREGAGPEERRTAVVVALERVAERQQARLAPLLESLQAEGSVGFVRPVAIVNRVVLEGTASALLRIAESPEVARILPEWTSARGGRSNASRDTALGERFDSWVLEAVGAPALWEEGIDGRGTVVAAIDTGAFGEHEQLSGGRVEGPRGWFDPVEGLEEPYDRHGHGTSVLALAVGRNVDGRRLGVAPGARWAAALGNRLNVYSRSRMTLAADWVLRVARPDVLVNAWSDDREPCTSFDLPFIDAWKAADIFVVFPAGNSGPGDATGEAPAQLAGTYPDGGPVFSVAGVGPDGLVYVESSRGPSRCGDHPFPSIAAPGAEVPFAFPGAPDRYGVGAGTSLAAGVVAGGVALLRQAVPSLTVPELERALLEGARDVAPAGHDPATGAGRLDLPAALAAARRIARERGR